jgi:hypothetical protein
VLLMEFEKEHLSFDELVNEVNRLSNAQKIELIKKIVPNTEEELQHKELNEILDRYHDKFNELYKALS